MEDREVVAAIVAPAWHHILRHPHAAMASAAAAVAAVGVGAVLFIGAHPGHPPGAGARGHAGPGSATDTRGAPTRGSGTTPAGGGSGLAPSAASSGGSAAPQSAPGPAVAVGPGATAPRSLPSSAPAASPSSSAPAPGHQGTLVASVSHLELVAVNGHGTGSFTLTARDGPVGGYSISGASGLTVSPASGSLASGGSVTITVTSTSLIALDDTLTINPGGATVTVVLNVSL